MVIRVIRGEVRLPGWAQVTHLRIDALGRQPNGATPSEFEGYCDVISRIRIKTDGEELSHRIPQMKGHTMVLDFKHVVEMKTGADPPTLGRPGLPAKSTYNQYETPMC